MHNSQEMFISVFLAFLGPSPDCSYVVDSDAEPDLNPQTFQLEFIGRKTGFLTYPRFPC